MLNDWVYCGEDNCQWNKPEFKMSMEQFLFHVRTSHYDARTVRYFDVPTNRLTTATNRRTKMWNWIKKIVSKIVGSKAVKDAEVIIVDAAEQAAINAVKNAVKK